MARTFEFPTVPDSPKHTIEQTIAVAVVLALSDMRKDAERMGTILPRRLAISKVAEILAGYRITNRSARASAKKVPLTHEQWIAALKASPAYEGIDVDREIEKCRAWALTNGIPVHLVSRKRFVNWLNRADRPLGGKRTTRADQYAEPEGWRDALRAMAKRAKWDEERVDELCRGEWDDLGASMRADILKEIDKGK